MRGHILVGAAILALSAGCTPNVRTDSYSIGAVGQVNRTVEATVISARPVNIDGTQGGGAAAGAAIGGVAGSAVGGSDRANAVGAIGGLVVGAIAGAAAERSASETRGVEYVVQTINGNLMTIVQGPDPTFGAGTKVLVLYGSPSRIIIDPRAQ